MDTPLSAAPPPFLSFAPAVPPESAEKPEGSEGSEVTAGSEDGAVLRVDLPRLLETGLGLLVYGRTRSGKSYLVRGLLEQTYGRVQHIVVDSEGEFSTLRESFEYLIAAAGEAPGDIRLTVDNAAQIAARVMETGVSVVLDISDMNEDDRASVVASFLRQLLETPRAFRRPCFVVVDEVHRFAPEGGPRSGSAKAISEIGARGAKRGLIPVLATQNIAKTSKRAVEEIPNKLVGGLALDTHIDRAIDDLGLRRADAETLQTLPRGYFYAVGPSLCDRVTLVQTGRNQTASPARFVSGEGTPPPPASETLQRLIGEWATSGDDAKTAAEGQNDGAQSGGKADAASETKSSLVSAHAQITVLEKELSALRNAPPRVERVTVPAVDDALLARMEKLASEMTGVGHALLGGVAELRETLRQALPAPDKQAVTGMVGTVPEKAPAKTAVPPISPVPLMMPGKTGSLAGKAKASSRPAKAAGGKSTTTPTTPTKPSGGVSVPQQRILNALATFMARGVKGPVARANVAVWAGQSPRSSAYSNNLSALRGLGLVEYPDGQTVRLTPAGAAKATPVAAYATQTDLLKAWCADVSAPQARILEHLAGRYPRQANRVEVARATSQSPTSSAFANNLSALRSLGLVDYPDGKTVVATALLFPSGLPQ